MFLSASRKVKILGPPVRRNRAWLADPQGIRAAAFRNYKCSGTGTKVMKNVAISSHPRTRRTPPIEGSRWSTVG